MKVLSPNDSSHTITVYVRDHTTAGSYLVRLRNEATKEIEDIDASGVSYDSVRGLLDLTFAKTVLEGQYYTYKVYSSKGLTVDSTMYSVDSTVLTCDMTILDDGAQLHRGMIYCTAQADLTKFSIMVGEITQPVAEQHEFIIPD